MTHNRLQIANKIARRLFTMYHRLDPYDPLVGDNWDANNPEDIPKLFGAYRKVRKFCSGYCCGNPRKHFGKVTLKERSQLVMEKLCS